MGSQSLHRPCPSPLGTSSSHAGGVLCPILTAPGRICSQPHLTDKETEVQREYRACQKCSRRSGSLISSSPTRPGPPEGLSFVGAVYSSAATLPPPQFPHPQRGWRGVSQSPKKCPLFSFAHLTKGSLGHTKMAVAILSLRQQRSAEQHQRAGLRPQCDPAKPPTALALDVKWALSHLAHKNQE